MGPRLALPNEVATYDGYQRQRPLVKPGMTRYWQTRCNRDSITFTSGSIWICGGHMRFRLAVEFRAAALFLE